MTTGRKLERDKSNHAVNNVNFGKPVLFQYQHKKKGHGPDYTGMGNVMTALTDKINKYFVKKTED
ncbi:MAG: hypothetical protein ACJA08_000850 [Cyclobacteriaceae bacterium]